jgi:hypothetical protein
MAITSAALQAEFGTNAMSARVLRADETQGADATKQEWYVSGNVDAPGRVRWVSTTAADNAATQAAAVLTALRA